jgi:N-acetylglucosamine malate deacetylase 1
MNLDILAFGVHPDDVELGCAGTILAAIHQGKKVGIIDLTQGELGTRGTIETRKIEAANAAKVLGVSIRENLQMQDGFFENNKENQLKIIEILRKYTPKIVLCNATNDRHPDHAKSAKLVADACFLSGLRKIETTQNGNIQEAFKPMQVFHYIQDRYIEPNFVVDISQFHDKKIESILCYTTQFYNPELNEPQTYISSPLFLESIKARATMFGKRIGVNFAEGFTTQKVIGISNFDAIISNRT